MNTHYIDRDTRTICDLSESSLPAVADVAYEVNRINTPQPARGKGHASRLMRDKVLPAADKEGAILHLVIVPTGSMNATELAMWYSRLGFMFVIKWDRWVRYPR